MYTGGFFKSSHSVYAHSKYNLLMYQILDFSYWYLLIPPLTNLT